MIIVASVSCIYGLGAPEPTTACCCSSSAATEGMTAALRQLVEMQYERTAHRPHRGNFRVRGDVLEILPAYEDARSASSSSATRSRRSPASIRSAAGPAGSSTGWRSIPGPTTSRRGSG